MTFNEILKEFDEQFTFTDNWGTFVGWYEQNDGTKGYYTNDKTKSFLKQSFIRYLQGEVEIMCKRQKNFERKAILLQKKNNRTARENMLFTRWTSHASELGHQVTRINNQIKELEG